MTDIAAYRFFSMFRRGLASTLPHQASGVSQSAPTERRSKLAIGIKVADVAATATLNAELYGPGDVLGLDPALILRTEPATGSTGAAWNYLAAIDFALPELPWLCTPGGSSGDGLRPWLVLVVLKADVAGVPQLRPGRALPSILLSITNPASLLPDLSESWAWAHAQALAETPAPGDHGDLPVDKMVSRLICPQRLKPGTAYWAYLVPAFNHGCQRGLGEPITGTLAPAWQAGTPAPLELPVYYHWPFRTPDNDEDGDFECMARKLERAEVRLAPESVACVPADVSVAAQVCTAIAVVGALGSEPATPPLGKYDPSKPPSEYAQGLQQRLEALTGLRPPLYGGPPTQRTKVGSGPEWLQSLNLDVRLRVAAGLGAEIVRANQEDFVHLCWTQLGDVLRANALLNRTQLARVIGQRAWQRHFAGRNAERLLSIGAPWLERLRLKGVSFAQLLRESSVPNQIVDPALRRLLSPRRPLLRRALRRAKITTPVSLLGSMNQPVDARAMTVTPDGIASARFLTGQAQPADYGFQATALDLAGLKGLAQTAENRAAQGMAPLAPRPTVATNGAVLPNQIEEAEALTAQSPGLTSAEVLNAWSAVGPGGYVLLTTIASGQAAARRLSLRSVGSPFRGQLILLTLPNGTARSVGRIADLPRPPTPEQVQGALNAVQLKQALWPTERQIPPYRVVAGLAHDPGVGQAYSRAFEAYRNSRIAEQQHVPWRFVPWPLPELLKRATDLLDPEHTILERVGSQFLRDGNRWKLENSDQVLVSPDVDRIWASPRIPEALYAYLATYDRHWLLPGIDGIGENQVVGLAAEPAFVQAFLAGANWEMNRELIWRGFPADGRGTVFTRFWDWPPGTNDIEPIHTWIEGHSLASGPGGPGQLMLLIRGPLIACHPNTAVFLAPGKPSAAASIPAPDFSDQANIRQPVVRGRIEPDILFFGFDLTKAQAKNGAWYLVFQEQPAEPRFGLDKAANGQQATSWSQAAWKDVDVGPGDQLSPRTTLKNSPEQLGTSAAQVAARLYQKPFRMCFWLPGLLGP